MDRVLKPGGIAIVSTPNLGSWHNMVSLLLGKQPFVAQVSNEVHLGNSLSPFYGKKHEKGDTHLRAFTYDGLKELLEYHKFRVEKIIGVGYLLSITGQSC